MRSQVVDFIVGIALAITLIVGAVLIAALSGCTEGKHKCFQMEELRHYAYQHCETTNKCLITPQDVADEQWYTIYCNN